MVKGSIVFQEPQKEQELSSKELHSYLGSNRF